MSSTRTPSNAPPITLASPRYRIVLGDVNDPETWGEIEVQAITRDLQAAEGLFIRHKWGKPQEQPLKMTVVSAYFAAVRAGLITGSWDEFERSYLEVSEAGADAVPPTPGEPEPA